MQSLEGVTQSYVELVEARFGLVSVPLEIALHDDVENRTKLKTQCVKGSVPGRIGSESEGNLILRIQLLESIVGRQLDGLIELGQDIVAQLHITTLLGFSNRAVAHQAKGAVELGNVVNGGTGVQSTQLKTTQLCLAVNLSDGGVDI